MVLHYIHGNQHTIDCVEPPDHPCPVCSLQLFVLFCALLLFSIENVETKPCLHMHTLHKITPNSNDDGHGASTFPVLTVHCLFLTVTPSPHRCRHGSGYSCHHPSMNIYSPLSSILLESSVQTSKLTHTHLLSLSLTNKYLSEWGDRVALLPMTTLASWNLHLAPIVLFRLNVSINTWQRVIDSRASCFAKIHPSRKITTSTLAAMCFFLLVQKGKNKRVA